MATERNVDGYLRLADIVDGNAYYWSSVNPTTYPGYQEKLDEMSQVIHEHGGLWVAPAAPGFDVRLIGGSRVVERLDGETLRTEMNTAVSSSPDAVGLISWNEFSENTHIEPSQKHGTLALDTLADIQSGLPPVITDFDSSAPATTDQNDYYSIYILVGLFAFIALSIVIAVINRSQHQYRKVLN